MFYFLCKMSQIIYLNYTFGKIGLNHKSQSRQGGRRTNKSTANSYNVCGQMKFLEARSQQSEHKTKLQFGASLCG
jgi:hypothetical protein